MKATRSRSAKFMLKPGRYRVRVDRGAQLQFRRQGQPFKTSSSDVMRFRLSAGRTAQIVVSYGVGAPGDVYRLTGDAYGAAWSPDGTLIAYISSQDGGDRLFVKNLQNGATTAVGPSGVQWFAWSPDSKRLAVDQGYRPSVIDVATGQVTAVSVDVSAPPGDSSESFYCSANFDVGSRVPIARNVFSPDGTRIVFSAKYPNSYYTNVVVKDLVTGQVDLVSTPRPAWSDCASWSPDGTRIAFSSTQSNRDDLVYVKNLTTGVLELVSVNTQGQPAYGSVQPAWSPDGTALAFVSQRSSVVRGDTNGRGDVFVKNFSTGTISRISTTSKGKQLNGDSADPIWSPDGRSIAFWTNAQNVIKGLPYNRGDNDIVVKSLDTGRLVRVAASKDGQVANGYVECLAWSPDGKQVAFESDATNLVPGDKRGGIFIKTLP